jgi:hypothetical protein
MLGWFQALMPREERSFEPFARQRAVLAALGKALVLAPPPAPLGELVRALRRAAALHRVSPPPLPGTTAP